MNYCEYVINNTVIDFCYEMLACLYCKVSVIYSQSMRSLLKHQTEVRAVLTFVFISISVCLRYKILCRIAIVH